MKCGLCLVDKPDVELRKYLQLLLCDICAEYWYLTWQLVDPAMDLDERQRLKARQAELKPLIKTLGP
jgi:hypothetical protein